MQMCATFLAFIFRPIEGAVVIVHTVGFFGGVFEYFIVPTARTECQDFIERDRNLGSAWYACLFS